jgi:uncharacterized protein
MHPALFGEIFLQGTSFCNLNCWYCYLDESSRKNRKILQKESLSIIFEKIFKSQYLADDVYICWHEGEPLTLPISYYIQSISIIEQLKETYRSSDFKVSYGLRTNASLITQKWCDFFKQYNIRVGVSCDGPAFLHDINRRDWRDQNTHFKVVRGMDLLKENGIHFNMIATLSPQALDFCNEFFDFFYQYRHVMDSFSFGLPTKPNINRFPEFSDVTTMKTKYYQFIRTFLKRLKEAPEVLHVSSFSEFYRLLYHWPTEQDKYIFEDGSQYSVLNVDADGNVSAYMAGLGLYRWDPQNLYDDGKGFILGNLIQDDSLDELLQSHKSIKIYQDFATSNNACKSACEYYGVCGGGHHTFKYLEHGTFEATETLECQLEAKTFADALLDDMQEHLEQYVTS